MSRSDDELAGEELLSSDQLAAVRRYQSRTPHTKYRATIRDQWAAFEAREQSDEDERFYNS